jgi:hypothetical protein
MSISHLVAVLLFACPCALAADRPAFDYRLLATRKTSTLELEMNDAARNGFRFEAVMGGTTATAGNEGVVVMSKRAGDSRARTFYKLLATSRTGTMQRELQEAGQEGFEYRGQTVFESAFGGREVCVILERDPSRPARNVEYKLLATQRTSTMEKELRAAGAGGFEILGMTVGKTAMGGNEVICILRRVLD